MKAFKLLTVLLIAMTMLTGCDFFRSILGKPTSKDIERMRMEAETQAKKQRQLDSINRAVALELEVVAIEEEEIAQSIGRYHVILGSFKKEANARRMYAMLERNGYQPQDIKFRNGFDLVSVASYGGFSEAVCELDKLRAYNFCPEDVWVYDTEQGLHER